MYTQDNNSLPVWYIFCHQLTTISQPILIHFWWELYQGWPGMNIGAQGAGERQMLGTQKEDAANGGLDGACDRMAAPTVSDDLAMFAVFLVIKCKGDVGGAAQIGGGGCEDVQAGCPNE